MATWQASLGTGKFSSPVELLDFFQEAAVNSDLPAFLSCFTGLDARFLGTDPHENWLVPDMVKAFGTHFIKCKKEGKAAWVYKPIEDSRKLSLMENDTICVFDELLESESFKCVSRGNGTLVRKANGWLIAQYALGFPIPNDLAKDMCEEIAKYQATSGV